MSQQLKTNDQLAALFARTRTIAVVGAHPSTARPAYYVPEYLHHQGFRVIPVNPTRRGEQMWGEAVRGSLSEIVDPIDVVCFFRKSEDLPGHLSELLSMESRPAAAWLQLGIRNDAFAARLVAEGLDVVQDRCMLVEHKAAGLSSLG